VGQNSAVALFFALAVILAASRIGGAVARRFDQPRVLGELIMGVVLGPTLLDLLHATILHGINLQGTISQLADFGVLMLMFIFGLEVNLKEFAQVGVLALLTGLFGVVATIILGLPLVLLFGYEWQPALFAAVALSATSVSISAQVLLELGFLRTKVGSALLATALIDDVLSILLLSLAVAVSGQNGSGAADMNALVGIVARMTVYIGGAVALAWFVLPRITNWFDQMPTIKQSYGIPVIALLVALLFGWTAETWGGVAALTGAFIAGVGFSRTREDVHHEIETASSFIAYALLVPIFFINVGLDTNLRTFPLAALPLALLLLVVVLVSKVTGCGLGARLSGFTPHEALRLGVCMIPRGEVGLIVASIGLALGVFHADQPLFASLFLVILLTTVVTPVLVRRAFKEEVR
jgi:Na+:H+ antiporter